MYLGNQQRQLPPFPQAMKANEYVTSYLGNGPYCCVYYWRILVSTKKRLPLPTKSIFIAEIAKCISMNLIFEMGEVPKVPLIS